MNYNDWPARLYALDVTRGWASLGVVFWHWIHFSYVGTIKPTDFDRTTQPFYSVFRMFYERGGLGVDYFFLLSGFIFFWIYLRAIGDGKSTFKNFLIQRFSRLYPLHFVALLLVAALQLLYVKFSGTSYVYLYNDLYHFVLNLAFASEWGFEKGWSFNGPEWSVSIEILLYFVFFLVALYRKGGVITCILVALSSLAIWFTIGAGFSLFRGLSAFFMGGFVFYCTVYLAKKGWGYRLPIYVMAIAAWSLVFIFFYFIDFSAFLLQYTDHVDLFKQLGRRAFPRLLLFPLTVCSLALIEISYGPSIFKRMAWLGDITYSVYLLHFPLQLICMTLVLFNLLDPDFHLNPLALVTFYSLLLLLSYVTFVRFERPMQKLIRQALGKTNHARN